MLPRSFTARARKGELRMRKFLLLFAGALMLLSGCSTSEIGERAIIQAAAVDYDGEYIVSALLFSSGGGSGESLFIVWLFMLERKSCSAISLFFGSTSEVSFAAPVDSLSN